MKKFLTYLNRILFNLPKKLQLVFFYLKKKRDFYNYVNSKIEKKISKIDPGPVGKYNIILKTAILSESDIKTKTNKHYYLGSGFSTMLNWLGLIEKHGFNLSNPNKVLEFGCGSARLIRHLRCFTNYKLHGCDIIPDFINWNRDNIKGVEFYQNNPTPPLRFANDSQYDLIFAESVFTHIPIVHQKLWIEELFRALKDSGFLVISLLGEYHQNLMLNNHQIQVLNERGYFELLPSDSSASFSSKKINSVDTFQTRSEVIKEFGELFKILEYSSYALDLLVLQKENDQVEEYSSENRTKTLAV